MKNAVLAQTIVSDPPRSAPIDGAAVDTLVMSIRLTTSANPMERYTSRILLSGIRDDWSCSDGRRISLAGAVAAALTMSISGTF